MNLLLIGCGNIGGSLLDLWKPLNLFEKIVVVQPSMSRADDFKDISSVEFVGDIEKISEDFSEEITILAVKPQMLNNIVPALLKRSYNPIIVSVLASITFSQLASLLSRNSRIARIMPNVAIKTGNSLNLAYSKKDFSIEDMNIIENVFAQSGSLIWIEKESQFDKLAPISGSGPAYFFLLAELLAEECIKLGLDEKTARKIVQQVLIGSATLVENNNDFESLRNSVTSKGGITAEALKVMIPDFKDTLKNSLEAALTRSEELSRENRC